MSREREKDRTTRFVIWGMDASLSLDEVIKRLKLTYDKPIEYLARHQLIEQDKTLQNKWLPSYNGEGTFSIETRDVGDTTIKYVSAVGHYETQRSENRSVFDGKPISRDLRVDKHTVNALFYEQNDRVYCVLEVSQSQERNIRTILFGQGRRKIGEWGRITTAQQELPQYKLDSRFFYWLFTKRGKTLLGDKLDDEHYEIKVVDVSAVSQTAERETYDNKSEGADVLKSTPALSGLGINQRVYNGGFNLMTRDLNLYVQFDEVATCTINTSRSTVVLVDEPLPISSDKITVIFSIYTVILPTLKVLYHKEVLAGEWSEEAEVLQRKEYSLKVIKELMLLNGITLEEVSGLTKQLSY